MSFPAFIPKTILVGAITVKLEIEPIFIQRAPFFLPYILKSPKTTTNTVSYTHLDVYKRQTFTYAVNLKAGQTEVNPGLGAGNYAIRNRRCYIGNTDESLKTLCQSEFRVDKAQDVYKRQQLHRSDDSGNPESFEPIPVIGNYVQL